jgi:hypothetical protein
LKSFTALDPQGHQGKTNVWLTPRWILDALGDFDLDPCGQPDWKTAKDHFYYYGLDKHWYGRAWLNPPYGRDVGKWLKRLEIHGNGIALVFARTDTKWFQELRPDAINFMKGRVAFLRPNGESDTNAGTPSILMAWGKDNVKALKQVPGRIYTGSKPGSEDK